VATLAADHKALVRTHGLRLFAGMSARGRSLIALQWHGAEVFELPNGAAVLANSSACPIQSFRYGDRAYGLQFHVEVTEQTVPQWASIPACEVVWKTMGVGALQTLKDEVDAALPQLNRDARAIYDNLKYAWSS
jgi:GMP synthase-like glutamine amidotransferase